ncbi:hypothetical protein B6S12_07595 [Helicobacter valdiviensis]|uniref:KaiC-like domain-containing protein n=1 Tax=Helicobacter valdiviensis TaxID=1458358 RepID=A0A2W6NK04_9HELI|nr:ATPase domain-containing protein [Helicobacter valdiviensis]PZT47716.1 hypothetical protein B6S12_07595 [Helicobacter valdiviensis]
MEGMILKSLVDYQEDFFEFLRIVSQNCFSQKGQFVLKKMIELKEKEALSIQTLCSSLDNHFQESEYFLNFLSTEGNPNYLNFAQNFIFSSKLREQKALGERLKSASDSNTLLDLSLLQKELDLDTKEIKNLNEWIEFYKDKPKSPQYATKIDFLDSCFNGGFELGQLMLLSGDPEAGKTMLGLQILENLAKSTKVGFFCFEFTIEQYIRRKEKNPALFFNNISVINEGYDIFEIARNIKQMYKNGVKFFLIDSQMRITTPQTRSMEEEETLKFSTLARLCHTLGIFVILIIQTAKGDKDNPMGSKKGGHEASITLRIERVNASKEEAKVSEFDELSRIILVKKNKQTGKHFKEKVYFDKNTLTFSSNEPSSEPVEIYFEETKETKFIDMPSI